MIVIPLGAVADNGSAGSYVVPQVAGQIDGDYREVRISISASATITTPAGWALVSNTLVATTRRIYVFARTANSEGNTTFTFSASTFFGVLYFNLRDHHRPAPVGVAPSSNGNNTASTNLVAPDISPAAAALGVYSFHSFTAGSNPTFTPPASFTLVAFVTGNSATGHAVGLYTEPLNAGAAGTRTVNTGLTSTAWGACSEAYSQRKLSTPPPQPDTARRRAANL